MTRDIEDVDDAAHQAWAAVWRDRTPTPKLRGLGSFLTDVEDWVARPDGTFVARSAGSPADLNGVAGAEATYRPADATLVLSAEALGRSTFYFDERLPQLFSTSLRDIARARNRYEVDPERCYEYVAQGDVFGTDMGKSFLRGVSQIPPSCSLAWKRSGAQTIEAWHALTGIEPDMPLGEAVSGVTSSLERATTTALCAAGSRTVVSLVSGGLDSGVVSAFAVKQAQSLGVDVALLTAASVASNEEYELRAAVCASLGVPAHQVDIVDAPSFLPGIARACAGSSIPRGGLFSGLYEEMALACRRLGADAFLTGEGGDEVFALNAFLLFDLFHLRRWRELLDVAAYLTSLSPGASILRTLGGSVLYPMMASSGREPVRAFHAATRSGLSRYLTPLREPTHFRRLVGPIGELAGLHEQRTADDWRQRVAEGWYLTNYLTYRRAVRSAAVSYPLAGVQRFDPLLSLDVVRAASTFSLAERATCAAGFVEKRLLREAARGLLPDAVRDHRKIGVVDLLPRIVADETQRRDLSEALQSERLRAVGIEVDPAFLDPRNVPMHSGRYLMSIVVLSTWLDEIHSWHAA